MLLFLKKTLKPLLIALFSFSIIACDGFEYDSNDGTGSPERTFTRSELAFNVLFSSLLLNDSGFNNNRDGFVVLFNSSSNLDEIELAANDSNNALVGNYPWTIVDDKLQVTYPNGVTCTSSKTAETSTQYTASSTCEGGEPANDRIRNILLKPSSFDQDDISGRSVVIDDEDDDVRIDFFSNGTFEITDLDSRGDDISGSTKIGVFQDSTVFNNVVRLGHSDTNSDTYSLLVLLDGSLSLGTMLELKYQASTNSLTEVFVLNIEANNRWEVDSQYTDIDVDN